MKIYIANLGAYNENDLIGEWIELPFTTHDLEELFIRIGLGDRNSQGKYFHGIYGYEEYAIHDWDDNDYGIPMSEYMDLDKLNDFFYAVKEFDSDIVSMVSEVCFAMGEDYESIIDRLHQGRYHIYRVDNEEELAEQYYDEVHGLDTINNALSLFGLTSGNIDFKSIGRDLAIGMNKVKDGYVELF